MKYYKRLNQTKEMDKLGIAKFDTDFNHNGNKHTAEIYCTLIKIAKILMNDTILPKLPNIQYHIDSAINEYYGAYVYTDDDQEYHILLSEYHMTNDISRKNNQIILETILHEMCHTLPYGGNHGPVWRFYIYVLNRKYGLNIKEKITIG